MGSSRTLSAWIALAAMLFSAVSPALAAALFPHRPDILGRMLAIPAAPATVEHDAPREATAGGDDGCPHEAAGGAGHEQASHPGNHGGSGHESHDETEHAAHGTYCSLCLTASSVVTLASSQAALPAIAPAGAAIAAAPERWPGDAASALHRARGPPALSR